MAVSSIPARSEDPTARPTRAPRRPRGEGQWALGHREPLNPNERIKKDDDGLNVRARIETIYAHRGLRLHRPARPARPVPLVGPLHPAPARHRRRPDRGAGAARARGRVLHAAGPHRRRAAQHRAAARDRRTSRQEFAPRHRRHHRPAEHPVPLDPDRGRAGDLAAARERSACSTTEACGDAPREHAGLARWPASPPTRSSTRRRRSTRSRAGTSATRQFSNLPRKFKTAICGWSDTPCTRSTTSRSSASTHPEHGPGFDLWVGGGLSTNPMLAQRLGVWVPLDEVPDVWAGRGRHVPRLRLPPAAQPGPAEVPGRRLGRGAVPRGAGEGVPRPRAARRPGAARCPPKPATTSACTSRPTAGTTSASRRRSGRVSGAQLGRLADLAEAHGSRPGAAHAAAEAAGARRAGGPGRALVDELRGDRAGGRSRRPFRRGTMACTGIEFCKLAIVETKAARRRSWWPSWSGGWPTSTPRSPSTSTAAPTPAPASRSPTSGSRAARHRPTGDGRGLPGAPRRRARHGRGDAGFGRKLRGLKVTADELPDYVERVVRRYLAEPRPTASRSPPGCVAGRRGRRCE